jgi:uncharacterized membrane protein
LIVLLPFINIKNVRVFYLITNFRTMKSKLEKAILDSMSKNPNNWRGPFYFNPNDPRLFVHKIHPALGWTFNFASPYSYITLGLIILVTIASVVFS